jgi:thiosulfate/3-mercaptopyruvate sulfurtransferase
MSEPTQIDARVVVDPEWVADQLRHPGVRIVEIDVSSVAYGEGHIPGAVLWNAYADLRDGDYRPVDRAQLDRLLARSGIARDSTVVVYGYGASLGFWLMTSLGHPDVRILDGSRDRWVTAGNTWSTEIPAPDVTDYALSPEDDRVDVASLLDVREALDDPNQAVVDVRSELEFAGERFWPSGATENAGRPGHVPGAVSLPIERLQGDGGVLRSSEELARVVAEAGIRRDQRIITYCTIGNRASQAWFALKCVLNYPDVRVYYGSWVEWGKQLDTPVEP